MKRSHLAVIIAVVALVGVLFLPISVPLRLVVPGKIMPAREWTLLRDQEGSIGALLRDHTQGTVQSYALNRFERGDVVRLTLHPAIRPRVYVEAGDTIASISSSETERQLAQLTGELSTVLASLEVYASGEKVSIVDKARTQLARAEEQARQHDSELARLRELRKTVPTTQNETHPNAALYPANQRQSRTLHPNRATRMGLRTRLRQLRTARRVPPPLAAPIQLASTTRQLEIPNIYPIPEYTTEQCGGFTQLDWAPDRLK